MASWVCGRVASSKLRVRPPRLQGTRVSRPAGEAREMRAGGACLWGARQQELVGEACASEGHRTPQEPCSAVFSRTFDPMHRVFPLPQETV